MIDARFDVVIVGGGVSGTCAALACARHGARTALLQDRPVLGGNASSEIRMHISGASRQGHRKNARETGIIEEILLENQKRNPQHSFSVCDTILWELANRESNLTLYLNTRMTDVRTEARRVCAVRAHQLTTEKEFCFSAPLFVDATGDAMLAKLAGAEFMHGREGKAEFGESLAPEQPDAHTMGNSVLFTARDMGRPMPFERPKWAYSYTDEDIPGHRGHGGVVVEATSGYWWLELGGDERDVLEDGEEIRDELLKTLYGVWDHLKNQDKGLDNLALDWVGFLPGKRESRRVVGEYVLRQDDLTQGRVFPDDVAYGGWHLDLHPVGGFRAFGNFQEVSEEVRALKQLKHVYGIPYRCLYARSLDNLFVAGRAISVSHVAFGSTRVMGTCALVGQAVGTAAALAAREGALPAEFLPKIDRLQYELMKDDCFLPGKPFLPTENLGLTARASASSGQPGCECEAVNNGLLRPDERGSNCWRPAPADGAPCLSLKWDAPMRLGEVILRFDSNFDNEFTVTVSDWMKARVCHGVPKELPHEYEIEFLRNGSRVDSVKITRNYQRFNRHILAETVICDEMRLLLGETHGGCPGVFAFEAYAPA